MKKIKKNIKKNVETIIIAIIAGLASGTIGSYAVTAINGSDVVYSNKSTTLQAGNVQSAIDELYVAASASFLDRMYPVGSIYISTSLSSTTAVANALGGTWESFGSGKTLVGVNTSDSDFSTVSKSGGSKSESYTPAGSNSGMAVTLNQVTLTHSGGAVGNHTLTISEMPSHTHKTGETTSAQFGNPGGSGFSGVVQISKQYDSTAATGGGGAHNHPFTQPNKHEFTPTAKSYTNPTFKGTTSTINHLQPYITVYMYKRTK